MNGGGCLGKIRRIQKWYYFQPNDLGVGVVGVVEADFLEPIHNKQDFKQDGKYK